MSHQQVLEAIKGLDVEELPLIAWDEAATAVGGEEPDEMFLVELLVTFYHEALPHLQRLLACSLAYREGATQFIWTEPPKPDPAPRPMEKMVKEEAHAIKGSAANLRLYRLAKAAERVELPAKGVMAEEGMSPFPPAVVRAVLDPMCAGPCIEIKRLVDECRAVTKFMAEELPQKVAGTLDLAADLLPETYEQLGRISLADFDARTFKRFAAFWGGSTATEGDGGDHHRLYADGGRGVVAAAPAVVHSAASNGTGGPAAGSSDGPAGGSAQTLTSASGVDSAPPLTKRHLPSSPDDGGPMAGAGLSFTTASRSLSVEPLAAAPAAAQQQQQPAAGAAGGPAVAAAAAGQPPQPAAPLAAAAAAPLIAAGAAAATAAAVSARAAGGGGGHWPAADPAPPLQMPSRGTASVNGGQTVTVNGHDGPGLRFGTTSVGGLDDGHKTAPASPGGPAAGAATAAGAAAGAGAGAARYAVAAEQSGESKGVPAPAAAAKLGQPQPAAVQPQPFKGAAGAATGAAADGAGLPSSQTLHGTPSSGQPSQPPLPTPALAPLSGATALITGTPSHGAAPPAAS